MAAPMPLLAPVMMKTFAAAMTAMSPEDGTGRSGERADIVGCRVLSGTMMNAFDNGMCDVGERASVAGAFLAGLPWS